MCFNVWNILFRNFVWIHLPIRKGYYPKKGDNQKSEITGSQPEADVCVLRSLCMQIYHLIKLYKRIINKIIQESSNDFESKTSFWLSIFAQENLFLIPQVSSTVFFMGKCGMSRLAQLDECYPGAYTSAWDLGKEKEGEEEEKRKIAQNSDRTIGIIVKS